MSKNFQFHMRPQSDEPWIGRTIPRTVIFFCGCLAFVWTQFGSSAAELDLRLLGTWPGRFSGGAIHVAESENIAYVARGGAGVRVIDMTNPRFPIELGSIPTEGH